MNNELKEILASEAGRLLREYLEQSYHRMNRLDDMIEHSGSAEQALEVKARLRALKIIKEVISEIIDAGEFTKVVSDEDQLFSL